MRLTALLLSGALAACATQTMSQGIAPSVLHQRMVQDVIRAALEADAAQSPADTLYMIGATIVADGRVRVTSPRFAGVGYGGRVSVTGFQAEIASGLAWAMVDYRWMATDGRSGALGKATVVLEPVGDGWRIKHVHSSAQ